MKKVLCYLVAIMISGCANLHSNINSTSGNPVDRDDINSEKFDHRLLLEEISPVKKVPKIPLTVLVPVNNIESVSRESISINITETVPLQEILSEICNLANLDIYLKDQIPNGIKLYIDNQPADQVLKEISKLANLRYKTLGKVVYVSQKFD